MDSIQKKLLEEVADLHDVPQGAYSLRINGKLEGKNSSENIEIVQKTDKPGIDIYIKPGTKNESLHIPVILSQSGLCELVYQVVHFLVWSFCRNGNRSTYAISCFAFVTCCGSTAIVINPFHNHTILSVFGLL